MKSNKISLMCSICCAVFLSSCSQDKSPLTVQKETINQAVYASGEILPNPYAFVQAASNDVISYIAVKIGDVVKEGDIVAFLGAVEHDQQLTVLRKQLEIAKATANLNSPVLNEFRQKIDAAKSRYDLDKKNAERYIKLASTAAVSQKEADDFRLQAEISRLEYVKSKEQYTAKINELSGHKLEIENFVAQANTALKGRILRSKISGKVLSIPKRAGESVRSGENIMLIGNDASFQLKLLIDERDIHKVKAGQKVAFETDAYPNQVFHARLGKIDALINTELRSVKAEAMIDGRTFFYPQSAVEANIMIKEKQKALLIPADYLFAGDTVLMKEGKNIQKKKVLPGLRIGTKVEISKGIEAGDVIYKNK